MAMFPESPTILSSLPSIFNQLLVIFKSCWLKPMNTQRICPVTVAIAHPSYSLGLSESFSKEMLCPWKTTTSPRAKKTLLEVGADPAIALSAPWHMQMRKSTSTAEDNTPDYPSLTGFALPSAGLNLHFLSSGVPTPIMFVLYIILTSSFLATSYEFAPPLPFPGSYCVCVAMICMYACFVLQ